jgi:hypothetical protein
MKAFRSVVSTLAFVVGVLLIAHSVWNWMSGVALERTLKEQAKRGLPMSMQAVMPAPVPESRNAAPVLDDVFRIIHTLRPDDLFAFHPDDRSLPAAKYDLRALDMAQKAKLLGQLEGPVLGPVFERIREAAALPECNFESSYPQGLSLNLPHVGYIHNTVRLLCLRFWLRIDSGRVDEALDDITAACRVAGFLRGEPFLLSQYGLMSSDHAICVFLNAGLRMVAATDLPADRLRLLYQELGAHIDPGNSGFVAALDTERIMIGKWFFEPAIRGDFPAAAMGSAVVASTPPGYFSYAYRPVVKTDYRCFLDTAERVRSYAGKPYFELARLAGSPPCHAWFAPVTGRLNLTPQERFGELARHQAWLSVARTGIAVLVGVSSGGEYPGALDGVKMLGAPPLDPFSGEPLRYRSSGRGATVYSVGPDGKDETDVAGAGKPTGDDIAWSL